MAMTRNAAPNVMSSGSNILQGDAVDGGEHEGHEGTDADKAAEAGVPDDEYGAQRTGWQRRRKGAEEFATVDEFHKATC